MEQLQAQLAQLSAAQVRALLAASGHAGLASEESDASAVGGATGESGGGATAEEEAARWKDEGNASFRAGRLQDALAAYSRCVELDPGNAVCLSNRAAALLKLERYEDAVRDCGAAIQLAPSIKPYMRRATAYIALGKLLLAVDDLAAALNFEPSNNECAAKLESIAARASSANIPEDLIGDRSNLRQAYIRACIVRSVRHGWKFYDVKGNPSPGALNGHALFEGLDKRIYLFGGRSVRDNKAQLFVLDPSDYSWDAVSTHGDTPGSRAWHTVTLIDAATGALCIYGGVSSQGEDPAVYLLVPDVSNNASQLTTWKWIKTQCNLDKKQIPDARSGHAAVSLSSTETSGTQVFVFGGRTRKGVTNAMYKLSLVSCSKGSIRWEQTDCRDSMFAPAARDGHSMNEIKFRGESSSKLIVFGGNGQENDVKMNDTWVYDVECNTWEKLECTGKIPNPRSYHTAHVIEHCLIIIGGRTADTEDSAMYVLDTVTREWFEVPVPESHQLTPRAWHSSVLTDAGSVFLMGGGTYHGPLRDSATLDLSFVLRTLGVGVSR